MVLFHCRGGFPNPRFPLERWETENGWKKSESFSDTHTHKNLTYLGLYIPVLFLYYPICFTFHFQTHPNISCLHTIYPMKYHMSIITCPDICPPKPTYPAAITTAKPLVLKRLRHCSMTFSSTILLCRSSGPTAGGYGNISMGISGSQNGGTVPYKAIFCGDIHLHRPYIGLIYGRYLHFRIQKFPLNVWSPGTQTYMWAYGLGTCMWNTILGHNYVG